MLDGLIARNPATLVKRPNVARREAKHLDANTVAAVLQAAEGLRYRPVLVVIAATGLRRGEALALRWEHLNLKDGTLEVAVTLGRVGAELVISEPKSPRSRRTVPSAFSFARPGRVGPRCGRPTRLGAVADHRVAGSTFVGCVEPRLRRARVRRGRRRGRCVPPVGVGADHRADQQRPTRSGCWRRPVWRRRCIRR
jgi:integrase